MSWFNGKTALITGGARGLGLQMALAFAREGANIVLTDINPETLEKAREQVETTGVRAFAWPADVTDPVALQKLRENIRQQVGPIDILVNNAGVVFGGAFREVPLEKHRATYEVNITGLTNVTWTFLPDLLERPEARIVNIASASGLIALPYGASYGASKWAAIGLSESLRQELQEEGHGQVRVTAVCPSFIDTGMFNGARAPRMTRLLDPEKLVTRIVAATRRGDAYLLEPFIVKLMPLFRLLPTNLLDGLARFFGVASSMKQWEGHQE